MKKVKVPNNNGWPEDWPEDWGANLAEDAWKLADARGFPGSGEVPLDTLDRICTAFVCKAAQIRKVQLTQAHLAVLDMIDEVAATFESKVDDAQ